MTEKQSVWTAAKGTDEKRKESNGAVALNFYGMSQGIFASNLFV